MTGVAQRQQPDAICELDATALAARLVAGELSAAEVLEAHLERIAEVNPALNAVVTIDIEGARARAAALDRLPADKRGPLHGMPIAIKDLEETAGIRTTYGSALFSDNVPATDSLVVARLRVAGAVIVGKTNTPEFGAGSQTFNEVFGPTRNPYDRSRTPGGSSGGAAVAVATGMQPLADGSDQGGSLRNPASFCNVVGLRPTPGRIPTVPSQRLWDPLAVHGPIARTVADAALLLGALSGGDPRAPLSSLPAPETFALTGADAAGTKIAWSRNLGGLPVAREVTATLEPARAVLAAIGCEVDDLEPDLGEVDFAFETLRGLDFVALAPLLQRSDGALKPTLAANIRAGLALDAVTIARALAAQAVAFEQMRTLLEHYDALALPAAQVLPFEVQTEYPTEIEGTAMGSYLEWMRICSRITVTAHPAIAVPAGFSATGLPVGLQLVGRYGGERELLGLAAAFEAATRHGRRRPPTAAA